MENMTNKMNNCFEQSGLYQFLGKEGAEDFRDSVKKMLLDRVENDLQEYGYYFITTEDVQDTINEAIKEIKQEVMTEIRPLLKKTIIKVILSGFQNMSPEDLLKMEELWNND